MAASATTACPTSGTNGKLYWKGTGSDPLAESDLAGNPQEEYIFFNGGLAQLCEILISAAS